MLSDALRIDVLLVTVVVLAAVVGVVVFLPAGSGGQSSPVGHDAADRIAELDGMNATVVTTINRGNTTEESVQHLSIRPSSGEMRATMASDNGTTLMVSNGSVMWMYDRDAGEVTRIQTGSYGGLADQQGERIERLFTRLNLSQSDVDTDERVSPTSGIAPLPVVPTGHDGSDSAPMAGSATEFGLRYEGTDTIDGREVYALTLSTPDDESGGTFGNYTQTMYVDTEWFVPLGTHTEWTLDGEHVEVRSVYRNVTFEPGLEDDLFSFEPPANATIEEFDEFETRSYDSLSALRENVSLAVPDPDLPASFDLDVARSTTGAVQSVSLQYSNETAQVVISKGEVTNATNGTAQEDGETVSIDGTEATYQRIAQNKMLSWTCDGYRYSVTGSGVSRALLVEVAESIVCE